MIHCLPESARDPFGRPILLVQAIHSKTTPKNVKYIVMETFERLRRHLEEINADSETSPVFQYIVILDVKQFSLKNFVKL